MYIYIYISIPIYIYIHNAVVNVNEGSSLILLRFKWARNTAHADHACKRRKGCQDLFPTCSSQE